MKAKKILLMDRHEICNPKIVTTEMFNEAIAELEALQQPKSCEGCKYEHKDAYSLPCAACVRNCDRDYYEPKKENN